MSNLSTLPKGDSAWLLRKAIERIMEQVSVLETNIGSSTTGNSANTQIIFNDNGTLRGDAGLVYNKTTDALTVAGLVTAGSATITGDLTVDTSTLKVDSTNNRVGVNNASPSEALDVSGNGFFRGDVSLFSSTGGAVVSKSLIFGSAANTSVASIYGQTNSATAGQLFLATETGGVMTERLGISDTGVFTFQNVGNVAGTAMTLNSTGLGIGDSPSYKLHVAKTTDGTLGFFRRISGTINPALTVYCNETGNTVGFGTDYAGATSPSITFTTGGVERLRIDATGNVGIGVTPSAWRTSVPFKALQIGYTGAIYGITTSEQVNLSSNYLQDTGGNEVRIQAGFATRYQQSSGQHLWSIAGTSTAGSAITFTQAMTLDASGNLLVGTTSVVGTERLIVTKTTVGSVLARFVNTNTTVDTYGIAVSYSASTPNDASHYFLGCFDSTTSRAFIYANGGLANYSANNVNLSDARTKTDIKPLTSYWNKIKALELVTFKYKDQTHDDDNIGLISQQVESVAPEFVSNEGFGETPADGVPLKSIYTTDLYHAAIKALQEAMTRIEVLESKLA